VALKDDNNKWRFKNHNCSLLTSQKPCFYTPLKNALPALRYVFRAFVLWLTSNPANKGRKLKLKLGLRSEKYQQNVTRKCNVLQKEKM